MTTLPKDPVMLMSYVNTQLRDFYPSLAEFCGALDVDCRELEDKLAVIDYHYQKDKNQFV